MKHSESENDCSDLCNDLIAIIVRQQGVFEYLLTLDLPPRARKTCEDMLDPVRAAGPAGNKRMVRILRRRDASEGEIS